MRLAQIDTKYFRRDINTALSHPTVYSQSSCAQKSKLLPPLDSTARCSGLTYFPYSVRDVWCNHSQQGNQWLSLNYGRGYCYYNAFVLFSLAVTYPTMPTETGAITTRTPIMSHPIITLGMDTLGTLLQTVTLKRWPTSNQTRWRAYIRTTPRRRISKLACVLLLRNISRDICAS